MMPSALCVFIFWLAHSSSTIGSMPESGLEKAAAASAVVAGQDPPSSSSSNGQQQSDLEARLKRITDTMQRVRGPDFETSERGVHNERLVAHDRPQAYHASAAQQQFMVPNDEIMSSGDGSLDDDEDDDEENGDFGSGEPVDTFEPEPLPGTGDRNYSPTRTTEGVYVEEIDTTRKPITTTTPKRARPSNAGTTRKPIIDPKSKPAGSTSSKIGISWSQFVALFCLFLYRTLSDLIRRHD